MSKNKLNLYKHRFYVFTMDLFSSTKICAKDHSSAQKDRKTKNPAGARFLSAWLQVVAASTLYYVNAKSIRDRCSSAQFKVGFLCHRVWMRGADLSKKYCSSIQCLSILGVFTLCHSGGRKFDRRNEVLAETGGAVSALTPREHTVLRQQRAVTGPRGNAWLSAAHPCRCRRRAGKPFMERTNYRPGQTPPATGRDKLATGSGKVRQLIVLLNHRRRAYGAEWILLF